MKTILILRLLFLYMMGVSALFQSDVIAADQEEFDEFQSAVTLLSISQQPVDPIQTVLAQGFERIGIEGTASYITLVNENLKLLMGWGSNGADISAPGTSMLNAIDRGTHIDPSNGFCVLIKCGDGMAQMMPLPYGLTVSSKHEYVLRTSSPSYIAYDFGTIESEGEEFAPHIVLAHELVHSWRAQTGHFITSLSTSEFISRPLRILDELETVFGYFWIPTEPKVPLISENSIRSYFNIQPRASYSGYTPNNFLPKLFDSFKGPNRTEERKKKLCLLLTACAAGAASTLKTMYGL